MKSKEIKWAKTGPFSKVHKSCTAYDDVQRQSIHFRYIICSKTGALGFITVKCSLH